MSDIIRLNVFLHDALIGTLNLLPGEKILFLFSEAYLRLQARPTLSLSFKNSLGNLMTDLRPTRGRLPTYFSNLLPEGPLRDYLAARAGVNKAREFFLLWALGQDLPGAIRVVPEAGQAWPTNEPHRQETKLGKKLLRFSLAGVQLKLSAVMEVSGGLTIPAEGAGGSWIVKLPSARFKDVPQNEYSMMTLARQIGMDIPDTILVPIKKIAGLPDDIGALPGQALAIKRFDRTKNGPVHTEDFAQVFGIYPEEKYKRGSYKNIAQVLWLETGSNGVKEFIRRLVFNVLIGNADMHLKNWSLIYPDGKAAELSPGYDFVSTIAYINDESMALKLVKSKRMAELSFDQLAYLAAKAGLPLKQVLDTAKETVLAFRKVWKQERKHLPMNSTVVTAIEKHVKTSKLWGEVK